MTPAEDTQRRLSRAEGYYELSLYDDAHQELESIRDSERGIPAVTDLRARLAVSDGNFKMAITLAYHLTNLADHKRTASFVYLEYARHLKALGRHAEAVLHADKAAALVSDLPSRGGRGNDPPPADRGG